MTKQEWIELLKTDVDKFNETREEMIDLSYANLSHADLSYADLRNANLSYADLSYADLRGANLKDANLKDANLRYADLSYADLRNANLSYANLSRADLSDADLSYADLKDANLRYADLSYADFDFSSFPLWCGSFNFKADMRLVYQLCYHICRLNIINQNGKESRTGRIVQKLLMPYANKFHRVKECGTIKYDKVIKVVGK